MIRASAPERTVIRRRLGVSVSIPGRRPCFEALGARPFLESEKVAQKEQRSDRRHEPKHDQSDHAKGRWFGSGDHRNLLTSIMAD